MIVGSGNESFNVVHEAASFEQIFRTFLCPVESEVRIEDQRVEKLLLRRGRSLQSGFIPTVTRPVSIGENSQHSTTDVINSENLRKCSSRI